MGVEASLITVEGSDGSPCSPQQNDHRIEDQLARSSDQRGRSAGDSQALISGAEGPGASIAEASRSIRSVAESGS